MHYPVRQVQSRSRLQRHLTTHGPSSNERFHVRRQPAVSVLLYNPFTVSSDIEKESLKNFRIHRTAKENDEMCWSIWDKVIDSASAIYGTSGQACGEGDWDAAIMSY